MLISSILNWATVGLLILIAAFVINTSEFAAAGSVTDGQTDLGSKVISGYTASDVVYNFDDNGVTLNSVLLDLNIPDDEPAPTELHVKLASNSNIWFNCTADSGNQWACDTTNPTIHVVEIDQLSVMGTRLAWN